MDHQPSAANRPDDALNQSNARSKAPVAVENLMVLL
jgi:hypothetical protein